MAVLPRNFILARHSWSHPLVLLTVADLHKLPKESGGFPCGRLTDQIEKTNQREHREQLTKLLVGMNSPSLIEFHLIVAPKVWCKSQLSSTSSVNI